MGILIFLEGLILVAAGLLGLQKRIARRMPDAAETIGRIGQNQGWIGAVAAVWGFFDFIYTLRWIPLIGAGLGALWISMFFGAILTLVLGSLFGYSLVEKRVKSRPGNGSGERARGFVSRVDSAKSPLGFLGVIAGAWILVYYVIVSSRALAHLVS